MEVIPAIDLRGGRCVRLYQGDYARETVFSSDPVAVARRWEEMGASRLHMVDLDGAALGEVQHYQVIQHIVQAVGLAVQVGGGVRSLESIEELVGIGVGRVVLGTAAVENPELVQRACSRFGEAIVVAVDARDGYVATRGWLKKEGLTAAQVVEQMGSLGARRFLYTDIGRDGTLAGPNLEALKELVNVTPYPIIASGGVASLADLERLRETGVEAAIVGRALYTGALDLRQAVQVSRS
ncbi:MAG: 1-(5-phosphoribosyl)-5-[(5-phosphoribosylamino)methylideneamino]imidazole-4-carboxamide isomerase [Chloroflexi bacterium]|nr:1-(5-phosphoribosyl)-5-[(5-phosphoribosylamino)methylideneamino]imidazole-4-carboxamide isomerase [Chloroflexota bacterium]